MTGVQTCALPIWTVWDVHTNGNILLCGMYLRPEPVAHVSLLLMSELVVRVPGLFIVPPNQVFFVLLWYLLSSPAQP